MGFKTDTSFLRFLTMGAMGVRRTIEQLVEKGFEPIELERYCGSNKIWSTKIKRLRLPDILCVKTGLRVEVRTKSKLEIKMSDAPKNPDRVWDVGLRDEDLVAFIASFDSEGGPNLAQEAMFFTVKALRESVVFSKLGHPKSAAEGAEQDRNWPAIVPSRDGTILEVDAEKVIVEMYATPDRPSRKQTYALRGKTPYFSTGDTFKGSVIFLAGAPPSLADFVSYLNRKFNPLDGLHSPNVVDRYAAIKALPHREDLKKQAVSALEEHLSKESEPRVALEAAGSAAAFGSTLGQERIVHFMWDKDADPVMRMEAVLILTELGKTQFTHGELIRIAREPLFQGDEIRQAAVWGLGKTGLKAYADLLPFIDDTEENVAMHAIAAFGTDTPRPVIDKLVKDLLTDDSRRPPAASEALRIIGNSIVLDALVQESKSDRDIPAWILTTLGRLPSNLVRERLQGTPLLDRIAPMLLMSEGANWLASEKVASDISFLIKQNL